MGWFGARRREAARAEAGGREGARRLRGERKKGQQRRGRGWHVKRYGEGSERGARSGGGATPGGAPGAQQAKLKHTRQSY